MLVHFNDGEILDVVFLFYYYQKIANNSFSDMDKYLGVKVLLKKIIKLSLLLRTTHFVLLHALAPNIKS